MAIWSFEEKFNTLNDGNLGGQNSWVLNSGSQATVTTNAAARAEGAKGLESNIQSASTPRYTRAITAVDYGTFYFSIKKTDVSSASQVYLIFEDGTADLLKIQFDTDFIEVQDNTGGASWETVYSGLSADTWYRVGVQFECTTGSYEGLSQYGFKINLNGGSWSSEYIMATENNEITNITLQSFYSSGSGEYVYLDFISPNYSEATTSSSTSTTTTSSSTTTSTTTTSSSTSTTTTSSSTSTTSTSSSSTTSSTTSTSTTTTSSSTTSTDTTTSTSTTTTSSSTSSTSTSTTSSSTSTTTTSSSTSSTTTTSTTTTSSSTSTTTSSTTTTSSSTSSTSTTSSTTSTSITTTSSSTTSTTSTTTSTSTTTTLAPCFSVANLITKLRRKSKDFPTSTSEKFNGDADSLIFRSNKSPITDSSYTVTVDSVVQTETTNYTVDLETGDFTFVSAPGAGTDNVIISYKYARLSDTSWLDIVNSVVAELRFKLWEEGIDETTLTTVASQDEYDLDAISDQIFKVIGVWTRSTSNVNWRSVDTSTNITYFRDRNVLNVRPYLQVDGYEMKVRYLKYYDMFTATSDCLVIPAEYREPIIYFCLTRYLDDIINDMVVNAGATVKQDSYEPLNNLLNLRNRYEKQAEQILLRVKPRMPSTRIPTLQWGMKS